MSRLNHNNLVTLKGICIKPLCIVMEYYPLGALDAHLVPSLSKITWRYRICVAQDVAKGINYLHSNDIVHRDIRSSNILVVSKDPRAPIRVKVADFGTAVYFASVIAGGDFNERWCAPEIFKGEKYNEKVDQYSYGILLWELLVISSPYEEYQFEFSGKSRTEFERAVIQGLRPTIPKNCPVVYREMIEKCWAATPNSRPTFTEIENSLNTIKIKENA
eukprot:TRINITY_DN13822_c0_g1_i1.p1 TRINITY_DN13822_c0_g1~~TRINITY_DN13822_c0_g1_i1.p1  ORF type:complete len:237 (-),score=37.04 TRINITY_DN13822_c0_g1_i1:41-694(-)